MVSHHMVNHPANARPAAAARRFGALWPGLVAALCGACASVPPVAYSYDELLASATTNAEAAPPVSIEPLALQRAFAGAPDFGRRLRDLTVLEEQALALMEEPLRLGAVGSAILDIHYASLVGHRALASFYEHVELSDQADLHRRWERAIVDAIAASAGGNRDADPYQTFSANEARAFLAAQGLQPIGDKYHQTDEHLLQIWIQARTATGPVRDYYFDLTGFFNSVRLAVANDRDAPLPVRGQPVTCREFDICADFPLAAFIQVLAVRGEDTAAQTFIGWKIAGLDSDAGYLGRDNTALFWLENAARRDNGLAIGTLADLYLREASRAQGDAQRFWLGKARNAFERIAALGMDGAMFTLGRLYAMGAFGADKVARGMDLWRQAAQRDNIQALLALAAHHAYGGDDARDDALAERYFLRAAERDEEAKVQYARFLLSGDREFDERAWRWLNDMAEDENADAMVLIGYLYAKGRHVDRRLRRAKSWLKSAVKAAPLNAHVVNEVAWTLTVSPLDGLRDARYALKIMDRVMADESTDARRVPAYLDTWAAAYAANGDFEQAIAVQEEAIEQALERDDTVDIEVLHEHLEAFRAGQRISEDVP